MNSACGPRGPHILKGALVFVNQDSNLPQVIPFQYNPSRLTTNIRASDGRWGRE